MFKRTEEDLNNIIENYLKGRNIYLVNPSWRIKESPLGGFGVFAMRGIDPGEIILYDIPVILGPRFLPELPDLCIKCYSKENLKTCKCGLSICKENCQLNDDHSEECDLIQSIKPSTGESLINSKELLKCLTPLRSLLLNHNDQEVVKNLKFHSGAQHGREIEILIKDLGFKINDKEKEYLIRVCSVLDANAFEVVIGDEDHQTSLRGLYPLGSLANHRCYPNTYHVFDEEKRMVVRAAVAIETGEEIFHSYTRLIWSTYTRGFHLLNTKHFLCNCDRCQDPTEFGTYMGAIMCKNCKGNIIPINPFRATEWKCEVCRRKVTRKEVGNVLSLVGSVLKSFDEKDVKAISLFLNKLSVMVPESNQVVVELKCKIIWTLGHQPEFLWREMPIELLIIKREYCKDVLRLLEKLKTGQCKIRGLLLYEMFLCNEEIKKRENNNIAVEDSEKCFEEAADILRYDVSAPDLIKKQWQQCNGVNGNAN